MPVTRKYNRDSDRKRIDRLAAIVAGAVYEALDCEAEFDDPDVGVIANEVCQTFKARCLDHLAVEETIPDPYTDNDVATAGLPVG